MRRLIPPTPRGRRVHEDLLKVTFREVSVG
jgi:hypothetical protein